MAVHALLDGRDTPPQSALGYLDQFERDIQGCGRVTIATVGGRYFGMDRDKRWDRVSLAYNAIVEADAPRAGSARAAVEAAYADDITDEFVKPTVIGGYKGMQDGDAVVMINFRADRARQILTALLDPGFDGFARKRPVKFAAAKGMVEYSTDLAPLMQAFFPPTKLKNILGEVVSNAGLKQLRIAETEKYAHVTFFLNGGEERLYDGEERILVPSPKVATYDLKPEMSAREVTDALTAAIRNKTFDLIVVNFANTDMVGHTGKLDAAIKAIETVDECLGRVIDALDEVGGCALITADHGNAEQMRDPETGAPHTAHTTNPVPLVLAGRAAPRARLHDGRLADLAPSILALMGLPQPGEMTGRNLVEVMNAAEAATGHRINALAFLWPSPSSPASPSFRPGRRVMTATHPGAPCRKSSARCARPRVSARR